jgi:hypothetical protein
MTVITANWVIRKTRDHPELQWAHDLGSMIQVSFAGFAVGGSFLGLAYWDLPYHLMAIAVLTKVIVRDALAAPAPAVGVAAQPPALPPAGVPQASRGLPSG